MSGRTEQVGKLIGIPQEPGILYQNIYLIPETKLYSQELVNKENWK